MSADTSSSVAEALRTKSISLEPLDNNRLANLCGPLDKHICLIERRMGVEIASRGADFQISGAGTAVDVTADLLQELYGLTEEEALNPGRVHLFMQRSGLEPEDDPRPPEQIVIRIRKGYVGARGGNQGDYLHRIRFQ